MRFQNPTALAIHKALVDIADTAAWRTYDGPHLSQLRSDLGTYFDRQYVRLCCSGTLAVELAIRSLKLPKDSEILLAGYDYPGNFRAIQDAGTNIRLCDIQRGSWTPDVEQLQSAMSPQTRAIIVSHLHGSLASMKSICHWAKCNGLFVIEDACQEPAATVDDKLVGSWGDLSVLSFGGSKLLAAGRGGAVMTNDHRFAQRMTIHCDRGNDAFALSELHAAILLPQLHALQKDNLLRRAAATSLLDHLQTLDWIQPDSSANALAAYYKLGLRVTPSLLERTQVQHFVKNNSDATTSSVALSRDFVVSQLVELGIQAGVGFRGFVGRSSNRCRRSGPLNQSVEAVNSTLVIHHSHLLDPDNGDSSIPRVIDALSKIERMVQG